MTVSSRSTRAVRNVLTATFIYGVALSGASSAANLVDGLKLKARPIWAWGRARVSRTVEDASPSLVTGPREITNPVHAPSSVARAEREAFPYDEFGPVTPEHVALINDYIRNSMLLRKRGEGVPVPTVMAVPVASLEVPVGTVFGERVPNSHVIGLPQESIVQGKVIPQPISHPQDTKMSNSEKSEQEEKTSSSKGGKIPTMLVCQQIMNAEIGTQLSPLPWVEIDSDLQFNRVLTGSFVLTEKVLARALNFLQRRNYDIGKAVLLHSYIDSKSIHNVFDLDDLVDYKNDWSLWKLTFPLNDNAGRTVLLVEIPHSVDKAKQMNTKNLIREILSNVGYIDLANEISREDEGSELSAANPKNGGERQSSLFDLSVSQLNLNVQSVLETLGLGGSGYAS